MADSPSAPSTPLKSTNLSTLKVVELRAELSARNLSPKGVKKDLVKRLQDAIDDESGNAQVGEEDEGAVTGEAGEEAEEAEEELAEGEKEEGEKEENGANKPETKGTPTKKTPKRNASSVIGEAGRRSSGRRGSNVAQPSPLSKAPETPTRTAPRRAVATNSELLNTPTARDEVEGDAEENEERHDREKAAEDQANEEKEEVEAEKISVPKEPVQVADTKTDDEVESNRKRTRSGDDEEEKSTEEDTQHVAVVPTPVSPAPLLETKKATEDSPQEDVTKIREEDRVQAVAKDLPERTVKRRRKEDEEADVGGDVEVRREQGDHAEQRTEIPKTKTPVTSPQKVKRIYSPIKAPPESEPAMEVREVSKERAIEPPRCDPSPCIYISGLHRPLTAVMLKKKLGEYGTIEKIWMDRIKTRCYVTFSDKAAAVSARTEMNDTVWPPNTGRTLTVDYLPTHRYDELVTEEEKAMETGMKLSLTPDPNPSIAVKLVEVVSISLPPSSNSSASFTTPAPSSVLPPALSGRVGRPTLETRTRDVPLKRRASVPQSPSSPPASSNSTSAKLIPLETLFRKTNAKPHLYYLPLTDEQVAERKIRAGSGAVGSRRN